MKNPRKDNNGTIFNTPIQLNLNLKIGAKVMLIYNVDVMDSLTNGTIGQECTTVSMSCNITRTYYSYKQVLEERGMPVASLKD